MSYNLITNRLFSLKELDGVDVTVSGPTQGTVRVAHERHLAPEFEFHWCADHFVGYFMDEEGKKSQSVVSLYTPLDAIRFVAAYAILNDIRSNQRGD